MLLKFREWALQEAISLLDAAKLFGYQPGDMIDNGDLVARYRKLMMQHHPDRQGDPEIAKQVSDGRAVLAKFIGQKLPTMQGRPQPMNWQNWQRNPDTELKKDVQEELTRGIAAIKRGQPEDAFAAVSRLVDPNTGKLNNPIFKPLLKSSLEQWLNYYKQGFHNYLEPILTNALKLV